MISMTGYSIIEKNIEDLTLAVEIKSVNSRFLEIYITMPSYMKSLENEIKQITGEYLSRGKVEIYISIKSSSGLPKFVIDNEKADLYTESLKLLAKRCKLKGGVSLKDVLSFEDVMCPNKQVLTEQSTGIIMTALKDGLQEICLMRRQEGQSTFKNIIAILSLIDENVTEIKKSITDIDKIYFNMLKERINELIGNNYDETRVITEAALLASKSCINEELQRLTNHISVFKDISENSESSAKKLDFLSQEMQREINTIASKVMAVDLTKPVINIKHYIEQIREQLRNVE